MQKELQVLSLLRYVAYKIAINVEEKKMQFSYTLWNCCVCSLQKNKSTFELPSKESLAILVSPVFRTFPAFLVSFQIQEHFHTYIWPLSGYSRISRILVTRNFV